MTIKKPFKYSKFNFHENALKSDTTLIGWTYFYTRKAYFHQINRRHDSTLYYANKAIEAYSKLKKPPKGEINNVITSFYIKGVMLNKKKKYRASTKSFINSLETIDKFNPRHNYKGYAAYFIAVNQNLLGDSKLVLKYANIALKDPVFKKLSMDYGGVYQFLAFAKEDLKELDSAIYYHHKSRIFSISKKNIRNTISSHNNLGNVFKAKGEIDSVRHHFNKANELLQNNVLDSSKGGLLSQHKFVKANLAYLKIIDGDLNKAEEDLNNILLTFSNAKIDSYTKEIKNTCYDYLIECYYKKKEFKKIIEVSERKNKLLIAYQNEFIEGGLQELETVYEVKKKEKKINVLSKKNKEQATILYQQKIISGILGALLILLCIAVYLFLRQRKLKSNYEKVILQQKLLRLQMSPHFLFNALSSLCGLVNEKSKNTIPYITKLSQLLRLILKNSRQDFISIEEEKQILQDYLDLESNFNENFNFKLSINECIDEKSICIPPMLVQPFVENAIQHGINNLSDKGEINITFTKLKKEKMLNCRIKDNGIGYYNSKTLNKNKEVSFSGIIIKERLEAFKKEFKVDCRFEISSNNNHGTEINLFVPFILDL
ncbi:histidine kinase [Tenacibaculum sp. nBUS_03]|uniref:histidine kinase n=1 Tax=Tenacibaculum sp. nBUS_03 TaxID=3395320 RepID=UPI003EB7422E